MIDEFSTSYLKYSKNYSDGYIALECSGDGNYLYNAASLVLVGDETLSHPLRYSKNRKVE